MDYNDITNVKPRAAVLPFLQSLLRCIDLF
jgi:hypothetical protein